ncbi:MAG: hypothetical protein KAH06_07230 [Desulfobacterales bacterium]|nr:hypothetical protein [Desulfobacterales bacterium]
MEKVKWVQGKSKNGVRTFLKELLNKDKLDAILMPAKNKTGTSYAWFLMNKNGFMETADPVPPVMTIQGARVIKDLTVKGNIPKKTAVVLRPCELRATVELLKHEQVNSDNLILISFDCPGAYPLNKYIRDDRQALDKAHELSLGMNKLEDARSVCSICHRFTGDGADIQLGFLGADDDGFFVIAGTERGGELVDDIDDSTTDNLELRKKAVEKLKAERTEKRDQTLNDFAKNIRGTEKFMNILSACVNCHNCSRVCPICFCRECYFDSSALRNGADNFIGRAKRKEGLRMPSDRLLFHLGRMNHMSISCVSCGACEDACPADIPVSMMFSLVGRDTQAIFKYEAGRDPDEELPLTLYKNEEFKEWEAQYTKRYKAS